MLRRCIKVSGLQTVTVKGNGCSHLKADVFQTVLCQLLFYGKTGFFGKIRFFQLTDSRLILLCQLWFYALKCTEKPDFLEKSGFFQLTDSGLTE